MLCYWLIWLGQEYSVSYLSYLINTQVIFNVPWVRLLNISLDLFTARYLSKPMKTAAGNTEAEVRLLSAQGACGLSECNGNPFPPIQCLGYKSLTPLLLLRHWGCHQLVLHIPFHISAPPSKTFFIAEALWTIILISDFTFPSGGGAQASQRFL